MLDGTVEIDHFHLGGSPESGRMTTSGTGPERSGEYGESAGHGDGAAADVTPGAPAGDARAAVVTGLSLRAAERAIEIQIETHSHLMSDEAKAFMAIGESFAKHETVKHSSHEYVRDTVHVRWRVSIPASGGRSRASFTISAATC
ncbi:MAG: hypothetical protein EOS85_29295 [Mesorhizobium sp.]|nr:MAG: hypothetical protein EOS85_29295 [Mesorhizobium sp.]